MNELHHFVATFQTTYLSCHRKFKKLDHSNHLSLLSPNVKRPILLVLTGRRARDGLQRAGRPVPAPAERVRRAQGEGGLVPEVDPRQGERHPSGRDAGPGPSLVRRRADHAAQVGPYYRLMVDDTVG